MLSGSMGAFTALPPSLARAVNISPRPGTTFRDAKHVVMLMQENRSFDHVFARYRGVRGLDDPRAIRLPDGNPVFLQTDEKGDTYMPFRYDIHRTKITWMGSLPHGRDDQVKAANHGKYDKWLQYKKASNKSYKSLPLTLGFYHKEDIPFYHAMADSFTVCDHFHCSIQGPTTPNRIFFWTGTNRNPNDPKEAPRTNNGMINTEVHADWTSFPERLEKAGISWRVYQNSPKQPFGFRGEEYAWLGNFGCNSLEYFSQYRANNFQLKIDYYKKEVKKLEEALSVPLKKTGDAKKDEQALKERVKLQSALDRIRQQMPDLYPISDSRVTPLERTLHEKTVTANTNDPEFGKLTEIEYELDGQTKKIEVPAGDVFYQFREDVKNGTLPTISWLVPSTRYSDHPTSPWYGAWYVSEALDILTSNPEVWKDTIFILTYDENDGYFDHIPPYAPPVHGKPETGRASEGIDTTLDFDDVGDPLGLGYRIPVIVASPWTRGGRVCSQLFDNTSILRFLEVYLEGKGSEKIKETNISAWRRTIVGDMSSVFQGEKNLEDPAPKPVIHDAFVEGIHQAQFKETPDARPLTAQEIEEIRENPRTNQILPAQEPGSRTACALPYELYVHAGLNSARDQIEIRMNAGNKRLGADAVGAPFQVYAPDGFRASDATGEAEYEKMRRWSFATKAGDTISHHWSVKAFPDGVYHLETYAPNGYFWRMRGSKDDPELAVSLAYGEGDEIAVVLENRSSSQGLDITVTDLSYGRAAITEKLGAGETKKLPISLAESSRWYDLKVTVAGNPQYSRQFAGHMENGEDSSTDPLIGKRATLA